MAKYGIDLIPCHDEGLLTPILFMHNEDANTNKEETRKV